jgi:hypothetical protein
MAAILLVIEDGSATASQLAHDIDRTDKHGAIRRLMNYLRKVFGSQASAYVTTQVASAFASAYVDCDTSDAVNATDTLAIAGSVGATLAVVASPTTQNQVSKGATDAEFATNVAAKINAHTTLSKIVRAYVTTPTNRVHVVAKVPGLFGNLIALAEVGNGFVLSAAVLSGGASDEADHWKYGYAPTGVS